MMHNRLRLTPLLCVLFCLVLCGCGGENAAESPAPAAAETAAAAPAPTVTPRPAAEILGRVYDYEDAAIDLSAMTEADVPAVCEALSKLAKPQTLTLAGEAVTPLSWESLKSLHDAAPTAALDYAFRLFGRDFNLSDTEMDLKYVAMDDEGALVGKVAACMTNLKTLDMDSCRVSNEAMAALRDSLPNTEVIWRVNFGQYYTARTNVTRILASMPGKAGELVHNNVMNLKYCTKVRFLDLGHNNYLDTIEFCRYMPDLEVLIAALSFVEDFSPLAECPKLEYLEAFTTRLHDLTPLANLKNLRHLNICYNFALTDISPLYGLTNLERLWIGWHDPVPPEQIARFKELVPNCEVNITTEDPTEEYWRFADHGDELGNPMYTPRYALLREQFGYTDYDYAFIWLDPLYDYSCPRQVVPDDVVDFQDLE